MLWLELRLVKIDDCTIRVEYKIKAHTAFSSLAKVTMQFSKSPFINMFSSCHAPCPQPVNIYVSVIAGLLSARPVT